MGCWKAPPQYQEPRRTEIAKHRIVYNDGLDAGVCSECDRLWSNFERANTELVRLVEKKYVGKQRNDDLEKLIVAVVEHRDYAKQAILMHELQHRASSTADALDEIA